MVLSQNQINILINYIEVAELEYSYEWGEAESLNVLISNNKMPPIYYQLVSHRDIPTLSNADSGTTSEET